MTNSTLDCDAILADIPPSLAPTSLASKSAYCLFVVIFSFITIAGNALVIRAVARFRCLQKRTNAFLVSAACADLGVTVFVMPFRLYLGWNGSWELGRLACLIFNMIDGLFCMTSMNILYCLAFERYLAVCRPFLHMTIRNRTTITILVLCWVIPTLIWSTFLFSEWHLIGIEDLVHCLSASNDCQNIVNVPISMVLCIGTFLIPSIFMIVCYWRIFVTARNHGKASHVTSNTLVEEQDRERNFRKTTKAAKTIAIIVGCFFFCWLPFFIVLILDGLFEYRISPVVKLIVTWLGYINSMVNPFLYYSFNETFKTAFKLILRCEGNSNDDLGDYRKRIEQQRM